MTNTKEMVHLSLDRSPELNEKLEEIANKIGGTKSDVLRQSLALMQIVLAAKEQGKKFGIAELDQPLTTEITIP